ncbi:MAG: biopolymer transporter ExbD [Candidatus Eremiobacteraeota bacterium]|nr:biopolymer transporter ExbD [Candidatus Eremiobacteraeota bacterium]
MKDLRSEAAVMSEINITPFTDVLLVLLIIFMILAALVTPPGFQRQVSCATVSCGNTRPAKNPPLKIQLSITRAGKIFVGSQLVDTRSIYGVLQHAASAQKVPRLAILADTKSPYGLVIRALDAAKAANISDVSFVTE